MITEVRVIGTGEILFRKDVPAGTCVSMRTEDVNIRWVEYRGAEHWITLSAPAKVAWDGGHFIEVGGLPPGPELPDRLEPIKNYLHREWEIRGDGLFGDGWTIARVRSGIWTDNIGNLEMLKGNKSLIKNAPRAYEALIALYNEVMEDSDKEIDDDVLLEVVEVAKAIEQGE